MGTSSHVIPANSYVLFICQPAFWCVSILHGIPSNPSLCMQWIECSVTGISHLLIFSRYPNCRASCRRTRICYNSVPVFLTPEINDIQHCSSSGKNSVDVTKFSHPKWVPNKTGFLEVQSPFSYRTTFPSSSLHSLPHTNMFWSAPSHCRHCADYRIVVGRQAAWQRMASKGAGDSIPGHGALFRPGAHTARCLLPPRLL